MNDEQQWQEASDDLESEVDTYASTIERITSELHWFSGAPSWSVLDEARRALAGAGADVGKAEHLAELLSQIGGHPSSHYPADPGTMDHPSLAARERLRGLDDARHTLAIIDYRRRADGFEKTDRQWDADIAVFDAQRKLAAEMNRHAVRLAAIEALAVEFPAQAFDADDHFRRYYDDVAEHGITIEHHVVEASAAQLAAEIARADAAIAAAQAEAAVAAEAAAKDRAAAEHAPTPAARARRLARAAVNERISRRATARANAERCRRERLAAAASSERLARQVARRLAELEAPAPPRHRPRRVRYCADAATPRRAPIAAHAPPTRAPRVRSTAAAV